MPPKMTPRADVDRSFLDLSCEIYENFLKREKRQAAMFPAGEKAYMQQRGPALAKALAVLRDQGDGRSGRDWEITRLRALPFTRFTSVTHSARRYLVGITKPITHDVNGIHYELGPYAIYVPVHELQNNATRGFHFIPTKAPKVEDRFMHHYAVRRNANDHPLDYSPSTCWGTFGETIGNMVSIIDIPELFRFLQIYLTRYDPSSPLRGNKIERLAWIGQ